MTPWASSPRGNPSVLSSATFWLSPRTQWNSGRVIRVAKVHRRRTSRISHPNVTTALVDVGSLRASRWRMRACCCSDLGDEAGGDAAGEKYGTDDDGDETSAPFATPDGSDDEGCDKFEVAFDRLTRVPKWKRVFFLMRERKWLMSHSRQSRTLMSHQPFIIRSE